MSSDELVILIWMLHNHVLNRLSIVCALNRVIVSHSDSNDFNLQEKPINIFYAKKKNTIDLVL